MMKIIIFILLLLAACASGISQTGIYRCTRMEFEGRDYDSMYTAIVDLVIVGSHFELNYPSLESSHSTLSHSEHGIIQWNSTKDTLQFTLEYMDTWCEMYYLNYCYMIPINNSLLHSGHNLFEFIRDTTLSVLKLPIYEVPNQYFFDRRMSD